jgi:diapolycopene oxygenase
MDTHMKQQNKKKKVAVVGAGLGGLSAAISLAQEGYSVEVYEKNEKIGGKLNVLRSEGYSFDLGPSILTLPQIFERLFTRSGRKMEDYFTIVPVRPHWRNFFEDRTVIDLTPDSGEMSAECRKAGEEEERLRDFLQYSGRLYDLIDEGYFQEGLDNAQDFRRHYGLFQFMRFDLFRSMHQGVARHLKSPYLRDIFDFFIKYVGSSAYDAPAFMNCLPTIQFRYDLWYVEGGMYNIAVGLERLMQELGIQVHLNKEIAEIRREGDRVTGLVPRQGSVVDADIVVCNMEVIPAYRDLLKENQEFLKSLQRFAPTCSGLVLELGLDTQYPQLAHHNFFFSGDQKEHFHSVFRRGEIPSDPTIYLVAASKSDPTVAPAGCDCLKILPHIPPIDPQRPAPPSEYAAVRDRILEKLERMGLTDLRRHIVFEHMWTPVDIERMYRSNRGSIYGVVSDRFKNFGFKCPKQSTLYPNLFFAGGSVNPGGGMPMVVLCGQNVARSVVEWDQ